ncbi:hypothetical protein GCM10009798_42270 [Nocardioides panacihumi]|uniref:Prepilin-type N-terminal cleavage/methylation domain-containing protein n=1 Tax=Nocardioides panacihumi TaxID=400774 RepID=A0ABN2RXE5_9ACTN
MNAPRLRRPGRLRADDGFTLVEMIMTVSIMGIVSVALTGIVLSYLRNTVDTEARLTESHDVQFAAAYWQRDVASIGVRSATYDTSPGVHSFPLLQSVGLAPCALPAGASAVVTLGWSEYSSLSSTDPPTLVKVTYAARPSGAVYQLLRVRCLSQPSTEQLADNLTAVPTVSCLDASGTAISCTGAGAGVPAVVRLALTVHDSSGHNVTPYQATLSGERRQT